MVVFLCALLAVWMVYMPVFFGAPWHPASTTDIRRARDRMFPGRWEHLESGLKLVCSGYASGG